MKRNQHYYCEIKISKHMLRQGINNQNPFYVHGVTLAVLQDKDLRAHVEAKHQNKKHFYVYGVNSAILQDKDLRAHVDAKHPEFKAFLCTWCEFGNILR